MSAFHWTEEMVVLLREKHAEGWSYGEIAAFLSENSRLGAVTRNACIGKGHRLGLVDADRAKRPKKANAPRPRAVPPKPVAPVLKVLPDPLPVKRQPIAEQVAEIVFLAPKSGLSFMEQRDGQCRFPISKGTDFASFRVCGCLCKMTQPYCDEHTKLTSQPSRPRAPDPERERMIKRNSSEMFFKDWV